MRFAYADPPYLGLAQSFYGDRHPDAADYDKIETHAALIGRLSREYPDGWAMSLHSPALRVILPLCPEDARVMAWVKPFASFKPNRRDAQFAWEPVIVSGGRGIDPPHCQRDWIATRMETQAGLRGAKPRDFYLWLFAVLAAEPADTLDDLFPGTGGLTAAWNEWRGQSRLFTAPGADPR